jgi:hypothetical protein
VRDLTGRGATDCRFSVTGSLVPSKVLGAGLLAFSPTNSLGSR